MSSSQIRSAIIMAMALGWASSPIVAQEILDDQLHSLGNKSPESVKPKVAAQDARSQDSDLGAYRMEGGAGLFGGGATTGVGFTQQTTTAGYELSGTGVAGGAGQGLSMTSPAVGRALLLTEGVYLYPAAKLSYAYNDNVTGVDTAKVASSVITISPGLVAEIKNRGDRYTLSYQGSYGFYQSTSTDNYKQHEFWLAADNDFTARFRTGLGVGYLIKTDARGSTALNSSALAEPSRWHAPVVRGSASYGASGAIGRLEFEGSLTSKRYDNNRATTIGSDVDIATMKGRFLYKVMPRTYAIFELGETISDYKLTTIPSKNSTDRTVLVGATWTATAKTEGTIKLGRTAKNFDDSAMKDGSGSSWQAGVKWSPLTYSVFDYQSSKSIYDSTGVGNFETGTMNGLTWTHKWASYLSSRVLLSKMTSEFDGSGRKDNTTSYGVGVFRDVGRNLRFGADYTAMNRDSNQVGADFKRNIFMLSVEGTL